MLICELQQYKQVCNCEVSALIILLLTIILYQIGGIVQRDAHCHLSYLLRQNRLQEPI